MKEVYWELITKEGERIEIPPASVDIVKKRWNDGDPIHTKIYGSIAASTIKYFRPTTKVYGQQPLLEAAAQAFKEPIFVKSGKQLFNVAARGEPERLVEIEYEGMECRWVKKEVTQQEWNNYYAKHNFYYKLDTVGGMVMIAFTRPTHDIDIATTPYCTDEEEKMLWAKRGK